MSANLKTLILARHAKSSWKEQDQHDFDRPLNARGIRDAPEMADRLASRNEGVACVVSSDAARALATARLLSTGIRLNPAHIVRAPDIYEAAASAIISEIEGLNDAHSCVLMVGHNPGMSEAVNILCPEAGISMPTCAMACLTLDIDSWQQTGRNCGSLKWYDYPKLERR